MSRPMAVTCKTGIVTPRGGNMAHRTTVVTATVVDGQLRYAAHLQCGRFSPDVVILADENCHGGTVCLRCDPIEPIVYRCYGKGGELLYIGTTIRRRERMAVHAATSRWWPEVDDITWERYATAADAMLAERIAIRTENPLRNKTGKTR